MMLLSFRSHQLKPAQTGSPGRVPVVPFKDGGGRSSGEPSSPGHPGPKKGFPHSPVPLAADGSSLMSHSRARADLIPQG